MPGKQARNAPFFSVIVPVHNKAATVERTVLSVLAQSFVDFEALVIDDASTDDTRAKIAAFQDDPRVRLFHRDSPGPGGYAARNLGIREARGIWLAFLDADDEWYPEHLEELNMLAARREAEFVATGWVRIHRDGRTDGNPFAMAHSSAPVTELGLAEYLKQALFKRPAAWTGAVGVRRSLMREIGGFPESCRRGGDVAVWLRLIARAGRLVSSPKMTAVYHTEDSTVTRTTTPEVRENCIYLACRALMDERPTAAERLLLMQFSNVHISHALVHRIRTGTLRLSDCGLHYAWANRRKHVFFRFVGLLPGSMQRSLWARLVKS
jgi:succinoglycan biosynthesis protein ExoO